MTTQTKTVVAAIVLSRYEEVLLLERAPHESYPGLWELPGGKVRDGEAVHRALRRELREETGLNLNGIEEELASFSYEVDGELREQRNFLVTVRDEPKISIRLSSEHSGWVLAPTWCTDQWPQGVVSNEVTSLIKGLGPLRALKSAW